jgi:ABC-type multidrug transport system fused ATPase/permease subunit
VAFVGESGSGKSTVFDLMVGLLTPQKGSISIDGVELEKMDLSAWRRQIGYVGQEPFLFYDTILNNILWGNPGATREQVEHAAKLAHAHDFIISTTDGYETKVGNRGVRLSGGERQRLALARALLRQPRLLLLDEATSSLDSSSERVVQEAIDGLRRQITIVIVAHRLATVRNSDWIYVLANGRIVQQGTWDQLTTTVGQFADLWQLQCSGTVLRSVGP